MKPDIPLKLNRALEKLNEIGILNYREHHLLAFQRRKEFLNTDFPTLKRNSPNDFLSEVINYSFIFCMFTDKEIRQKFKEIGFGQLELRWFIPWSDIEVQLEQIEKRKKLLFEKEQIFEPIKIYLINRINIQIAFWATYKEGKSFLKKTIASYERFLKRNNSSNPQEKSRTKYDAMMKTIGKVFDKRGECSYLNDDMKKILRQNINKLILGKAFKVQFQRNEGVTVNEFYRELFELSKRLVVDKPFYSNREYDHLSKGNKEPYTKYQSKRVFNVLFRD